MWKYLVALIALLSIGLAGAQLPDIEICDECYANIVTQTDEQTIQNVKLAMADNGEENVAVGNEGLSAGIILTPAAAETIDGAGDSFKRAPFARIDQIMNQRITNLGETDSPNGAKGVTWNKAIQAAWIAEQGVKENEAMDGEVPVWAKEGAYIGQSTTQVTNAVLDYDSREGAKVLNVDNKLAMIVDDLVATIALTAEADSSTTDSQTSTGIVANTVDVDVDAFTTGYPVIE